MKDYYLLIDNQQVGPYTADQLHELLAQGQLLPDASAWYDGLPDWASISSILEPVDPAPDAAPIAAASVGTSSAPSPAPAVIHNAIPVSNGLVQTNVKQGALIGSLVCLLLGLLLMYFTLFSFVLYGPLFLAAFILSIVAMAQGRVAGGIGLLLAVVVVPTVMGLILFAHRASAGLESISSQMNQAATRTDSSPAALPPTPTAIPTSSTSTTAAQTDLAEAPVIATANLAATKATPADSNPAPASASSASTSTGSGAPPASPHPALDAKNGFRTYKLGAPFSQFNADDMEAGTTFETTDTKPYFVKNFDKKLGAAEVDSICLYFQQDTLQRIDVAVKGQQSVAALKADLIAAYGQPDASSNFMTQTFQWNGNDCVLEMTVDIGGNGADASFTSKSVDANIKEITDQKAKAGAATGAQGL